jgi:hypothetical protein
VRCEGGAGAQRLSAERDVHTKDEVVDLHHPVTFTVADAYYWSEGLRSSPCGRAGRAFG